MIALVVAAALAAAPTLEERFAAPEGFARVPVDEGSYAAWLRRLPLLPPGAPLLAYDGRVVSTPHLAVIEVDVGSKDLQQCADSAMRLYAEWRWARGDARDLVFHATSGDPLPWARYAAGERFVAVGNKVRWSKKAAPAGDRATFRAWLDDVYVYAGSASLHRDTTSVRAGDVRGGDLYVLPGSPGHVVVVLDVAIDAAGRRRFLVGEGFMPAQGFHVVPAPDGSAWHDAGTDLVVPSWPKPFPASSLRRFR